MPKSHSRPNPLTPSKIAQSLLVTFFFNIAVALLLVAVGYGSSFWRTFIFSQCVGLSICSSVMLVAYHLFRGEREAVRAALIFLAIFVGAVGGNILGAKAVGVQLGEWHLADRNLWQSIGVAMIIGLIIAPFFYSRKKLADTVDLAQKERVRRLSMEKLALESDLKRLQAQIEPHFLFNTLSNILSLMDTDIARAKTMQLDLIRYLRTSLGRSRDPATVLSQEVDLIRAYLDIYKIRMGPRLEYLIDIPPALLQVSLPPMLLQPLVENALIHGLEPKIDGGKITLKAESVGGVLKLYVADTGNGLSPHHKSGVGLANVKKRLAQLYGNKGRLTLMQNQPSGVVVQIELPISEAKNDNGPPPG